jgi:hypothetical protein
VQLPCVRIDKYLFLLTCVHKIVFKTVLPILKSLIKTPCHCLMTSSMNILDNDGDTGHLCFTHSFICISLLLTDVLLSVFILVLIQGI